MTSFIYKFLGLTNNKLLQKPRMPYKIFFKELILVGYPWVKIVKLFLSFYRDVYLLCKNARVTRALDSSIPF
jgi:hypothetical protein